MQPRVPIMKPPLDSWPRQRVLSVEPPQHVEIRDLGDSGYGGVQLEAQNACGRRGAVDVRECRSRPIAQLVAALVDVRWKEEELIVLNAESLRGLTDSALAQQHHLAALAELLAEH